MNTCSLCHLDSETWDCKSCGESFCDSCFDRHFLVGPHIPDGDGNMTVWYVGAGNWPRGLTGILAFTSDGSGRGIWIPAVEPDEWQV